MFRVGTTDAVQKAVRELRQKLKAREL
jgi:hypothetical protein